ncbi:MAG: PAS domain-containing sensor histidine kinase, partial [Chrysiogenales bacterium]
LVMFLDSATVIQRIDTIALAIALMTVLPLAVSRDGRIPFVYGFANMGLMYAFMFYISEDYGIPRSSFWEYLADNTIAFAFVMIVSSAILKINNTGLDMAESLNIELRENNEELESTNEELKATIEELEATNEEFEAQNRELVDSQEELHASREELLAVFNGSHDAFIIFDEMGCILEVNGRVLEMFRVGREEVLSMNLDDLSPRREGFHRHLVVLRRVLAGETSSFEWEAVRPGDGITFNVDVGLSRLNRRGMQVFLAGVRDVTLRMRIEEAIKESERKYRLITENSTDMVFTMDMDFRFTYVSPSVSKILGYTVDEALGLSFDRIFTPASLVLVYNAMARTRELWKEIDPDRTSFIELEMYHRNGTVIWTGNKFSFLKDESGRAIGFTGVTSNISARKKAELERERIRNQLVQVQKMEAVGTLAGGIAHDLNNILRGVIGSLSLMEALIDREDQLSGENMKGYLETAMKSSLRAADLTRQLLTLSRKSDPLPAPMDITNSLYNVLKICKNSFPKPVKLDFTIPEKGIRIHGDPAQIEQVLLNLCLNASHAMTIMRKEEEREGGTLRVTADSVRSDGDFTARHSGAEQDTSYVRISIRDDGVGMDAETQGHLFEPFFTTKSKSEGTGLGLAMVYGIIQQHGGFIDVSSKPGSGSTFAVYLPMLEGEEDAPDGLPGKVGLIRGTGAVLVVDDENAILRVVRDILEQCGYQVISVENGADGVAVFEKEHASIGAVILDLSMPGMSGLEAFEKMKIIDPGVKVLLASGFVESESIRRGGEMGVAGLLRKPFTAKELSAALKDIMPSALT